MESNSIPKINVHAINKRKYAAEESASSNQSFTLYDSNEDVRIIRVTDNCISSTTSTPRLSKVFPDSPSRFNWMTGVQNYQAIRCRASQVLRLPRMAHVLASSRASPGSSNAPAVLNNYKGSSKYSSPKKIKSPPPPMTMRDSSQTRWSKSRSPGPL